MIARTHLSQKTSRRNRPQAGEPLVLIAIVALLSGAAAAPAQTVSNAPAGTRSLAETPFQLILPRQNLLGDWYGAHSWLEERGVTPTLTLLTDALGNPTGGRRPDVSTGNNVSLA